MDEVYKFLKECDTYYLATCEDNIPHLRPFGTVNIFEGRLYIQTGRSKDVAKQIRNNPHVAICAFNGSEWLRLSGILEDDERVEAKKAMLDVYPELRRMYDENDSNTEVFFFREGHAVISSFHDSPKHYEL